MDKDTVKKVARLARIEVTDAQAEDVVPKLNNIIAWVEQLGEVNTDNVEPLASVVDITLPMRADICNDGNVRDKILANAPEDMQGFFVVPKVVEQNE